MYDNFFYIFFFFSSRRRHTRCSRDWSSDVCSSDLHSRTSRASSGSRRSHARPASQSRIFWCCKPSAGCFLLPAIDRKSTRLNSSHGYISYAVFCLKKKKNKTNKLTLNIKPASTQCH